MWRSKTKKRLGNIALIWYRFAVNMSLGRETNHCDFQAKRPCSAWVPCSLWISPKRSHRSEHEKIGVSRCCAMLCMKAILLSPTRELAVQSAKVLRFECILLLQDQPAKSSECFFSVCMNVLTGTPNEAVDLKLYQQQQKWMEELSK